MSRVENEFGAPAVMICVLAYYLFTGFAKRRLGVGRDFYRLILPWGAAMIGVVALFAWLVDRSSLPKPSIFVPALLATTLSAVEWARWRSAKRSRSLPPGGNRA